jgi:hypothetical protein
MVGHYVLVATFAAALAAQEKVPTPVTTPAGPARERATALLQELAVPERCLDAARELCALGPAVLPGLHKMLVDPRPEVVQRALFVASGLSGDVESLRMPIRRCLEHKDPGIALAAQAAWPALDGGGSTLVTDYGKHRVVRFVGEEEREVLADLNMVMGVQQLENGNLLVAGYGQNRIVEFDANGAEVWTFTDVASPSDAERLPDGNTLIADSDNTRVIEVDRAGKIVWSYSDNLRPIDADRLANGNTLISSYEASGVVEVSPAGKVVWQWRSDNVRDADRLLDGTTLLTDTSGRCVLRVDAQHRTLRSWPVDFEANDAELQPSGHLVVGGDGAVVEFDHAGKEVWRAKVGYAGRVARHGVARR